MKIHDPFPTWHWISAPALGIATSLGFFVLTLILDFDVAGPPSNYHVAAFFCLLGFSVFLAAVWIWRRHSIPANQCFVLERKIKNAYFFMLYRMTIVALLTGIAGLGFLLSQIYDDSRYSLCFTTAALLFSSLLFSKKWNL